METSSGAEGSGRELKLRFESEDLSGDKLLVGLPHNEKNQPMLSGIPLLKKIGQGGMGAVYFGVHPRLNSEVAIKVLPFHLADQDPTLIKRFVNEARTAAQVKSPNIVNVLDVNSEADIHFLVMEFVDGMSASDVLKKLKEGKPVQPIAKGSTVVPEWAALEICIGAAEGLKAAHAYDIIHRDIKPDNIMIPREAGHGDSTPLDFMKSKLADLGLAKVENSMTIGTIANASMGTPGYMPPEQVMDAKNACKASDIFSTGATMYALLSGFPPFTGAGVGQIMINTCSKPHTPLKEYRSDISPATNQLIEYCLDKEITNRYPDASELLDALREARRQLPKKTKGITAVTLAFPASAGVTPPSSLGKVTPPSTHSGEDVARLTPPSTAAEEPGTAVTLKLEPESHPGFAPTLMLDESEIPSTSAGGKISVSEEQAVGEKSAEKPVKTSKLVPAVAGGFLALLAVAAVIFFILRDRSGRQETATTAAVSTPARDNTTGQEKTVRPEPETNTPPEVSILQPVVLAEAGEKDSSSIPKNAAMSEKPVEKPAGADTKNKVEVAEAAPEETGSKPEQVSQPPAEYTDAVSAAEGLKKAAENYLREGNISAALEAYSQVSVKYSEALKILPDDEVALDGLRQSEIEKKKVKMGLEARKEFAAKRLEDALEKTKAAGLPQLRLAQMKLAASACKDALDIAPDSEKLLGKQADIQAKLVEIENDVNTHKALLTGVIPENLSDAGAEKDALSTRVKKLGDFLVRYPKAVRIAEMRDSIQQRTAKIERYMVFVGEAKELLKKGEEKNSSWKDAADDYQAASEAVAKAVNLRPDGAEVKAAAEEITQRRKNIEKFRKQLESAENACNAASSGNPDNVTEAKKAMALLAQLRPGDKSLTELRDKLAAVEDRTALARSKPLFSMDGHSGTITSAVFSPDGKLLLTASWDQTARVWDADNGREVAVLSGHGGFVTAATFSPDGKFVATSSTDGRLRVWEITSSGAGNPVEMDVLAGKLDGVAFSGEQRSLIFWSETGKAGLWRIGAPAPDIFLDATDGLDFVAVNSEGTKLFAASAGTAHVLAWKGRGKPLAKRYDFPGIDSFTDTCYLKNGESIVIAAETSSGEASSLVMRLGLRDGNSEWSVPFDDPVNDMEISSRDGFLAIATAGGTVSLMELKTGKNFQTVPVSDDEVTLVKFAHGGGLLAACAADGKICWIDPGSGEKLATIETGSPVTRLVFRPDKRQFAIVREDNTIEVWGSK